MRPLRGKMERARLQKGTSDELLLLYCIAKGLYSVGARCNVPLHISYQPVEIISSKQIGYLKYRIDKDPANNI